MSKLIVLRGNAGSGKSTTAQLLRERLDVNSFLVAQDNVNKGILKLKSDDEIAKGAIKCKAIEKMCLLGKEICDVVILEGILFSGTYENLFKSLSQNFTEIYAYYFDLPFDETVKRHNSRDKAKEFGVDMLKKWWSSQDFAPYLNEKCIYADMSKEEIVEMILKDISQK